MHYFLRNYRMKVKIHYFSIRLNHGSFQWRSSRKTEEPQILHKRYSGAWVLIRNRKMYDINLVSDRSYNSLGWKFRLLLIIIIQVPSTFLWPQLQQRKNLQLKRKWGKVKMSLHVIFITKGNIDNNY